MGFFCRTVRDDRGFIHDGGSSGAHGSRRGGDAELGVVLHPEDVATACCHAEIGREVEELGKARGGRRTLLGLQADTHDVERCDWE